MSLQNPQRDPRNHRPAVRHVQRDMALALVVCLIAFALLMLTVRGDGRPQPIPPAAVITATGAPATVVVFGPTQTPEAPSAAPTAQETALPALPDAGRGGMAR